MATRKLKAIILIVGFSEMSLFTKGILIKKIEVYGGNIINIIKKDLKIHVEISYADF